MVVNTQFHNFNGRSFAHVLYLILMKDITVTPLDAARFAEKNDCSYLQFSPWSVGLFDRDVEISFVRTFGLPQVLITGCVFGQVGGTDGHRGSYINIL